jgi:hypothetical protein
MALADQSVVTTDWQVMELAKLAVTANLPADQRAADWRRNQGMEFAKLPVTGNVDAGQLADGPNC